LVFIASARSALTFTLTGTPLFEQHAETLQVSNTDAGDTLFVGAAFMDNPQFTIAPGETAIPPSGTSAFIVNYGSNRASNDTTNAYFFYNGTHSPTAATIIGSVAWDSAAVRYASGTWQLVGLPLQNLQTVHIPSLFEFNDGYRQADTLEPTVGYWARPAGPYTYQGYEYKRLYAATYDSIAVRAGWNIISAARLSPVAIGNIASVPDSILTIGYYGYVGSRYTLADSLRPGMGYFVKVKQDGRLVVTQPAPAARKKKTTISALKGKAQ